MVVAAFALLQATIFVASVVAIDKLSVGAGGALAVALEVISALSLSPSLGLSLSLSLTLTPGARWSPSVRRRTIERKPPPLRA